MALLAAATLGGLVQGLVRAVFTVGGLLSGLVLAAWNYRTLGEMINRGVHDLQLSNAIGFSMIALLVMVLGAILGSILSNMLRKMGLGCLDRIAGAAFGLLQGAVLVTLGILVTVAFYPKQQWLTESKLPRYFFQACHLSTQVSPHELSAKVQEELGALEESAPPWLRQGGVLK